MKSNSQLLRGLVTAGTMVALGCISNLSIAACPSLSSLAGSWAFSEQGTVNVLGYPWSEVGSFTINSSGKGSGIAIIAALQATGFSQVVVPLEDIRVNLPPPPSTNIDPTTCIGTASFTPTGGTTRTITFTAISSSAFDYLSTTGDITVIGHGYKRGQSQNNQ